MIPHIYIYFIICVDLHGALKATVSRWTDNFPTSLEGTAYPCITLSFPVASLNLSELRTVILPLPSVDSESVEIGSKLVYKTVTSNVLYMVFPILFSSIDHCFFKKKRRCRWLIVLMRSIVNLLGPGWLNELGSWIT